MSYTINPSKAKPAWANAEKTLIEAVIFFEGVGDIPFAASPVDSTEHGREIFAKLVAGDGGPIAPYDPSRFPDQRMDALRQERNRRLAACDWRILSDSPGDASEKAAWERYRQALRDLPSDTTDPLNPAWPTPPA